MEVVSKFFYSSCMKYLKLILLSNNIQNIGYLKGHPFIILIQKLYIVFCCFGLSSYGIVLS